MKLFLIIHSAITLIVTLAIYFLYAPHQALSFVVGAVLMLVNLLTIAWSWKNILAKKLIAWSVAIIVIKYAILGIIIYELMMGDLVDVAWFCGGMGVLLISCISFALSKGFGSQKEVID